MLEFNKQTCFILSHSVDAAIFLSSCHEPNGPFLLTGYGRWKELKVPKLQAFYAIRTFIELFCKDHQTSNWLPPVWTLQMTHSSTMISYRSYNQITKYWHHCDEATSIPSRVHPDYDKLYRVRLLIDTLKAKFSNEFSPSEYIAVDECIIPFRGRIVRKMLRLICSYKLGRQSLDGLLLWYCWLLQPGGL